MIYRKCKKQKRIHKIKDLESNGTTSNAAKISNILNKHFASVGHKFASQLPCSLCHFTDYYNHITYSKSFFFAPVTPAEVELEIISIPNNKAHGLYSCPEVLLKCARNIISRPLAEILNISIQMGKYPSKLKFAKVIPVFKLDDETDPSNYRPISLLSNFNRIFEKLMYKRLKSYLNKHEILNTSQYGFREGHATHHATLDIINTIQNNMDNKLFSCGIFIDLKKAFNTVNHDALLQKLEHYGIREIVNDCFFSYLHDRTLTTHVGLNISNKENIGLRTSVFLNLYQ